MAEPALPSPELFAELAALRQRVAALEAELILQRTAQAALETEGSLQHAALIELQNTLEEQGLSEAELRQELAEREAVHQAAEAERAQYQTLFELAPDGYLVTDAVGLIRQANQAAARLLGRPPEQLVGLPLLGFVASEGSQTFLMLLASLHETPQAQAWEIAFAPPHGVPFVAELTVALRQDTQPFATQLHWLLRDITARKEAEAALRQETAERQRLERRAQQAEHFAMLGRLAAGLSHEIRTPLSAIFLHVELLEEVLCQPAAEHGEVVESEVAESLAEIKTDLLRLDELVQDYLSLVRLTSIERTLQDIVTEVQTWAMEWRGLAEARGVTLSLEDLEEPAWVVVHASSLRRALLNLVQNAIDAMPQGGTLTLTGQRTATHVRLQIRDTGHGIPADKLPQVFEPLYTTKPGGTGLGLYIVREIATAHEGSVTVESVEGQGTTFTLTLPVAIEGIPQASSGAPAIPPQGV